MDVSLSSESYFKILDFQRDEMNQRTKLTGPDALYDVELYFSIRVKYLQIPRAEKHSRISGIRQIETTEAIVDSTIFSYFSARLVCLSILGVTGASVFFFRLNNPS